MNKYILIVDDDPDICRYLATIIAAARYTVETLPSAHRLIESVQKSPPDLILLDYHLPGYDGIMALKTLRKNGMFMPVIMLTSNTLQEVAIASFRAGAADFVPKPCNAEFLVSVVEQTFETRDRYFEVLARELTGYVSHKPGCGVSGDGECSCGLSSIIPNVVPTARRA